MSIAFSGTANGATTKFYELAQSERKRHLRSRWQPIFDESYQLMQNGQVPEGMDLLAECLAAMRESEEPQAWDSFCQAAIGHPVAQLVWQDPFTLHSFSKPRGYAGDAHLLDYIYRHSPPPEDTTPLGREIFDYMIRQLGAQGVRARAQILARMIDEAATQFDSPRILSIACGHLREAALSDAVREGRVGEFVALDQDADSLAEVHRQFPDGSIETVQASVRAILAEKVRFDNLHLVYAAGLYDYLADRVATRLTRLMFDMLAPGGRVLIANFAPFLPETGYMESFMAWKLLYRHPHEIQSLSADIPSDQWTSNHLFWDESESIIFLDLVKRQPKLRIVKSVLDRFALPANRNLTINTEIRETNLEIRKKLEIQNEEK